MNLSSLERIDGGGAFANANMQSLQSLKLPSLNFLGENAIATFYRSNFSDLRRFDWPTNLSDWKDLTFDGIVVPNLPGICMGKVTQFTPSTFQNITYGPSDMKTLGGRTHNNVVYISDFYGYACAPIQLSGTISNGLQLFQNLPAKLYNGSDVKNMRITHANEIPPPTTIGNITIGSDGFIKGNSVGTTQINLRFQTSDGLIGARAFNIIIGG